MDIYTKFAKTLSENFTNETVWSSTTGTIISLEPFVVKCQDKFFLSEKDGNLIIPSDFKYRLNYNYDKNVKCGEHECYYHTEMKKKKINVNDTVVLVPAKDGSIWYLIDKE